MLSKDNDDEDNSINDRSDKLLVELWLYFQAFLLMFAFAIFVLILCLVV